MSLNAILNEYASKRNAKILDASIKRDEIVKNNKDLAKIEDEISKTAIETTKKMITTNDPKLLKTLNKKIEDLKKKRETILGASGIKLEDLEPKFDCNKCNDTGYVGSELCSCVKQRLLDEEYNSSNIYNIKNQTFDKFDSTLYSDKVENSKYKVSARANIETILKVSKDFINNFDEEDTKNLLFTGNTGLGKTFLSSCIANEILKKEKTVLYQTAPEMFEKIISYRFGKENITSEYLDNILNTDLLIIDDLGTENTNALKMSELFNIINYRIITPNKKTIISTNLNLEDIMKTYDERIFSRIAGSYEILLFYGEDIRLKG